MGNASVVDVAGPVAGRSSKGSAESPKYRIAFCILPTEGTVVRVSVDPAATLAGGELIVGMREKAARFEENPLCGSVCTPKLTFRRMRTVRPPACSPVGIFTRTRLA